MITFEFQNKSRIIVTHNFFFKELYSPPKNIDFREPKLSSISPPLHFPLKKIELKFKISSLLYFHPFQKPPINWILKNHNIYNLKDQNISSL